MGLKGPLCDGKGHTRKGRDRGDLASSGGPDEMYDMYDRGRMRLAKNIHRSAADSL